MTTSMTEAPYSLTVKVKGNLLTVRGQTVTIFAENLAALINNESEVINHVAKLAALANGNK